MWTDNWDGKTIGKALAEAARRFGPKEAMVFPNGAMTFLELLETSSLVARGFLNLGVQRGDMVAVWMAGYAEWAYLYYGLLRIGAVLVPVNTRYKPAEIADVLRRSKAKALLFKDEAAGGKNYRAILEELCPELENFLPGQLASRRLPHLKNVIAVSEKQIPGCHSFKELLDSGAGVPEARLRAAEDQVQSEDVALLQFTSGTTAVPKGVLLFHSAMLRSAYYGGRSLKISEQDCWFSPQPFFHVGGSITVMLAPVVSGCTVVVQPYFNPTEALRLMEEYRCTVTLGHQPHYIEYLNHPDLKKRKLCLQKGLIFASPEVNQRVYKELGMTGLMSPYGLTETHAFGTRCDIEDPLEKRLTTVGRPQYGVEMSIRSASGDRVLPQGEPGEVCFRSWGIMKGYYEDPQKTAEVLDAEGWFRTGDVGVVDAEGYLRLIGRIKDMIRVGGENFAAAEVEAYLLNHPGVKQAAVVGAPDARLGETCSAFIEVKQGSHIEEVEIREYCGRGLASFKVPSKILFVNEWPMSGTGKIQKYILKESLSGKEKK